MREIVHIQAGQCGNQIGAKFGKSSLMNMASTQLAHTLALQTSSWNASMSTIMKPPVANMYLALFLLTWSQEPWTPSDQVPLAKSSVPITLSSANLEPVTTGPKVTTQKVLNLSTLSSMLYAKNLNPVIVSKDFN